MTYDLFALYVYSVMCYMFVLLFIIHVYIYIYIYRERERFRERERDTYVYIYTYIYIYIYKTPDRAYSWITGNYLNSFQTALKPNPERFY